MGRGIVTRPLAIVAVLVCLAVLAWDGALVEATIIVGVVALLLAALNMGRG